VSRLPRFLLGDNQLACMQRWQERPASSPPVLDAPFLLAGAHVASCSGKVTPAISHSPIAIVDSLAAYATTVGSADTGSNAVKLASLPLSGLPLDSDKVCGICCLSCKHKCALRHTPGGRNSLFPDARTAQSSSLLAPGFRGAGRRQLLRSRGPEASSCAGDQLEQGRQASSGGSWRVREPGTRGGQPADAQVLSGTLSSAGPAPLLLAADPVHPDWGAGPRIFTSVTPFFAQVHDPIRLSKRMKTDA